MRCSWLLRVAGIGAAFAAAGQQAAGRQTARASTADAAAQVGVRIDSVAVPSARFPLAWYPTDRPFGYAAAPVRRAPYSGDLVLYAAPGGGGSVAQAARSKKYRDGEGRTRLDESLAPGTGSEPKPYAVRHTQVKDPVSHCVFTWEEPEAGGVAESQEMRTAKVGCDPLKLHYGTEWSDKPEDPSMGAAAQTATEERLGEEVIRDQPLGQKLVNGVAALGVRHTVTLPESEMVDGKLVAGHVVAETWWSPQIEEVVLVLMGSSGSTAPVYGLENVVPGEPDPGLFYPPPSYRIERREP